MIGQILGNYKVLEQVGEGNMGGVYHALDLMLDREVALKALRPELSRRADVLERFREEAKVQAKLNHPNVAQMYTLFRYGDDLFMVMEYVQGSTLDTIIRESGRMTLDRALPLFLQALDGVEHAHRMGIIHRDLKPANIMVNRDGLVKVTDFGIARVIGSARMTREGAMIGTLEYMPPERVLGKEMDARSDQYSLGFVLYEMLSGNLPFTSQTEYEILRAQIETPPPPIRAVVPDVPPEIEQAILKSMAKNAADRFPTVGDFAAALRTAVPVAPVAETPLPVFLPRTGAKETTLVETFPLPPPPATPPPSEAPPPSPALVAPVEQPAATFPPATPNPPAPMAAQPPVLPPALPRFEQASGFLASRPGAFRYYAYGILGLAVLIVGVLIVLGTRTPQPAATASPVTVATPAPTPAPSVPQTSPPAEAGNQASDSTPPPVVKQPRPKRGAAAKSTEESLDEQMRKLQDAMSGKAQEKK